MANNKKMSVAEIKEHAHRLTADLLTYFRASLKEKLKEDVGSEDVRTFFAGYGAALLGLGIDEGDVEKICEHGIEDMSELFNEFLKIKKK